MPPVRPDFCLLCIVSGIGQCGSALPYGQPAVIQQVGVQMCIRDRSDPRASSPKSAQVLVHGRDGFELQAIRYAEQLREQGLVCELSVFDTEEAARQYAQRRGIPRMDVVYDKVEISQLEPALV